MKENRFFRRILPKHVTKERSIIWRGTMLAVVVYFIYYLKTIVIEG